MVAYQLVNKDKIRADSYILGFLVIFYLIFVLLFKTEAIFNIIVYPLVALASQGFLKIISSLNKRNRGRGDNFTQILLGIIYIFLSLWFLGYLISFPNITSKTLINLIAFPMVIVGIAGIIKSTIIKIYAMKYRIINSIIGGITIVISMMAFTSPVILPKSIFLFHIIAFLIVLILNVLGRATLYLSEFGLSLVSFRNFKVFFYIISDYLLQVDSNGNLILDKIQ